MKSFWCHRHGRRRPLRHFERLEDRSLLAVVSVDLNLYEDVDGSPGALIADETINVGDTFFLQITARENDPGFSGLQSVAIDLAWDPGVLEEIDAQFDPAALITPNLPLFTTGTLDSQAGRIRNLGGSSFPAWGIGSPIGSDGNDRFVKSYLQGFATTDDHFAWLHFRAVAEADAALLTLRQGGSRIATMPVSSLSGTQLDLERQTITVIGPSAAPGSDAAALPAVINTAEVSEITDSPHLSEAGELDIASGTSIPAETEELSARPRIEVANDPGDTAGGIPITTTIEVDSNAFESPPMRPSSIADNKFVEASNAGDSPLTTYEIQVNAPDVKVDVGSPSGDADTIVVQPGETRSLGEGEGVVSHIPSSNVCVATPVHRSTVSLTPPDASQSVPQARVRSTSFVGPLLPHEYATRLILAEPKNQLTSLADPTQLDDKLADVLATDLNAQYGPLTL